MGANLALVGSYEQVVMRSTHVAYLALFAALAASTALVWSHLASSDYEAEAADTAGEPFRASDHSGHALSISSEDLAREEAARWRGKIRGRLVDAADGSPVADYCMIVDTQTLRTDADGRFVAQPLPMGEHRLEFMDADPHTFTGYAAQYTHTWRNKEEIELRVVVGPTYRLALDLPPGLELGEFEARLSSVDRSDAPTNHTLKWQPPEGVDSALSVESSPVNENRSPFLAPLRGDTRAWVRFPFNVSQRLAPTGPWNLELVHRDGLAHGRAVVHSVRGRYPEVLAIEFDTLGQIAAQVFDERGHWPADCILSVKTLDGNFAGQATGPTEPGAGRRGNAVFKSLGPGHYTVRAIANGYLTAETTLAVIGGRIHDVRLDLTPVPSDQMFAGMVSSETGRFHATTGILLSAVRLDVDQEFPRRMTRVRWTRESGRWVGRFGFDQLPAGEYLLEPAGLGRPQWREAELRVRTSDSKLHFECLDGGDRSDLYMRVVDAGSGDLLPEFSLSASGDSARRRFSTTCKQSEEWADDRPESLAGVDLSCPVTAGFEWGHELSWSVNAEGYESAAGDARAFHAEVVVDGQVARVAEVRLSAIPQTTANAAGDW